MIRISVMYPQDTAGMFDMQYYANKHMALVHEKLDSVGLVKTEIDQGLIGQGEGVPPAYGVIGYLYFNTMDDFQKMLPFNDEISSDIPNFTNSVPVIQVSEMID